MTNTPKTLLQQHQEEQDKEFEEYLKDEDNFQNCTNRECEGCYGQIDFDKLKSYIHSREEALLKRMGGEYSEVHQLVKDLLSEDTDCPTEYGGSEVKITILQRGWVFVGRFSKEGSACKLTDAHNIRTWGTTKGLGEIAENGPTDTTKLDKVNDVSFHELGIVAMIDCDAKAWKKHI